MCCSSAPGTVRFERWSRRRSGMRSEGGYLLGFVENIGRTRSNEHWSNLSNEAPSARFTEMRSLTFRYRRHRPSNRASEGEGGDFFFLPFRRATVRPNLIAAVLVKRHREYFARSAVVKPIQCRRDRCSECNYERHPLSIVQIWLHKVL